MIMDYLQPGLLKIVSINFDKRNFFSSYLKATRKKIFDSKTILLFKLDLI